MPLWAVPVLALYLPLALFAAAWLVRCPPPPLAVPAPQFGRCLSNACALASTSGCSYAPPCRRRAGRPGWRRTTRASTCWPAWRPRACWPTCSSRRRALLRSGVLCCAAMCCAWCRAWAGPPHPTAAKPQTPFPTLPLPRQVARYRPDFVHRCWPASLEPAFTPEGLPACEEGVAHQTIKTGMRSFPSGEGWAAGKNCCWPRSSEAWLASTSPLIAPLPAPHIAVHTAWCGAGLGFLCLWLLGRLRCCASGGARPARLVAALLPLFAAGWIGVTRYQNNRWGSLLSACTAASLPQMSPSSQACPLLSPWGLPPQAPRQRHPCWLRPGRLPGPAVLPAAVPQPAGPRGRQAGGGGGAGGRQPRRGRGGLRSGRGGGGTVGPLAWFVKAYTASIL